MGRESKLVQFLNRTARAYTHARTHTTTTTHTLTTPSYHPPPTYRGRYRRVLGHLRLRLEATVAWADARLEPLTTDRSTGTAVPSAAANCGADGCAVDMLGLSITSDAAAADAAPADAEAIWDNNDPKPLFDVDEASILRAPLVHPFSCACK